MTDYGLKVCSSCGVEKPLSAFWHDARKPGGHETVCAACRSRRRADHRGTTQCPRKNALWRRALLPVLAARLCAAVHYEPAPPLPLAYRGVELLSPNAWQQAMLLICQGVSPETALRRVGIPRGIFNAHLRYEPRLAAWFARVKRASRRRRQPDVFAVDEVMSELFTPGMSARAACAKHGVNYRGFIARTKDDPELESRYLRIREMQQHCTLDDLMSEVDQLAGTRADRSYMARKMHALKKLEPRRLWRRKPAIVRTHEDKATEAAAPVEADKPTEKDSNGIPGGAGAPSFWREES